MKKKLLLAYRSGTGPYALNAMIARAFEALGWSVIPLNCMILDEVQLRHRIDLYEKEVDFYLEIGRGYLPTKTIKNLKIPTINWMPTIITNSENALNITKNILVHFDKVYTAVPSEISLYKKYGVTAYPLLMGACDEFCENRNIKKDIQIGLLGNMTYPSRINVKKIINKKYNMYITYTYHQYVELINRMEININIGLFPFCVPRRIFEILACGGFLLSYEIDEIDTVFKDGEHLVYFNKHNIIDKIEYYINHPEERKHIAKQGQDFVLKHHTFKHRILEIIKDVMEINN